MRLTLLLEMAADGFGERTLIGRRAEGITAADLAARARAGAAVIRERGADAIVYLGLNGPAFPVALFAAAYAGVPLVPLNYRLGSAQLDGLLAKHPKALGIADTPGLGRLAAAGIDGLTPDGWLRLTENDAPELEEPADGPAVIIYTSGTTSEPKGVLLRHGNLVSYVLQTVEFGAAGEDDAALVAVPPYHIAAVANVITNLYAGRRTITLETFSPADWLGTVRDEGVTNALIVPTMLARIVESGASPGIPTLRSLAYGGAPMPSSLIERALELWPDVGFVNAYGLTETSSTIALLGPDDHRAAAASTDDAARARLSSVGRPVPGVEIEIRGASGEVVPPGVPGRICVRGDQVSAEYAGVGRMVDERGFFDTRDEGYLDDEGYLFIGGRADDTIIRGAENIAPAEIEDVLLRHPAVQDAVVVGLPDEVWGQRIGAVVVTGAWGVEPEDLRAFARASLRSSKTPEEIWFWPELPRTETGKLIRRTVLQRLLGEKSA
ncbi:class I adenylate-forming enzyme family protein [Cryptosporangium sp. NPDC048952]|uniref:class I adenylate-forming enzyme family protein n=1 Tax=Cryptosporangium sp. NPDC048952 TaxID=3363961 RepID=UPI00370F997E